MTDESSDRSPREPRAETEPTEQEFGAETDADAATQPAPSLFARRLARVVTEALTPAVLVAVVSIVIAWHTGAVGWGIVMAMFASGIPVAYIVRGIRRGRFTDRHVMVREHRPAVIAAAAVSVVIGLAVMLVFNAPRDLVALVGAMLAGLALTLAVTVWWGKVSLHTAVAAGTATTLVLVFGPWLHLAWLAVALVAWSRVVLKEHTVVQTIVGFVLGALAAGVVFPIVR
jgi:membrane-associated phospholipid phosphatase